MTVTIEDREDTLTALLASLDLEVLLAGVRWAWDPNLHPRGKDGKFIDAFGLVRLFDFRMQRDVNGLAVGSRRRNGVDEILVQFEEPTPYLGPGYNQAWVDARRIFTRERPVAKLSLAYEALLKKWEEWRKRRPPVVQPVPAVAAAAVAVYLAYEAELGRAAPDLGVIAWLEGEAAGHGFRLSETAALVAAGISRGRDWRAGLVAAFYGHPSVARRMYYDWDPAMHPRGADGRFIEKFSLVSFLEGLGANQREVLGKVVGFAEPDPRRPGPMIAVEVTDPRFPNRVGTIRSVAPSSIYTQDTPVARLSVVPEPVSVGEIRDRIRSTAEEIAVAEQTPDFPRLGELRARQYANLDALYEATGHVEVTPVERSQWEVLTEADKALIEARATVPEDGRAARIAELRERWARAAEAIAPKWPSPEPAHMILPPEEAVIQFDAAREAYRKETRATPSPRTWLQRQLGVDTEAFYTGHNVPDEDKWWLQYRDSLTGQTKWMGPYATENDLERHRQYLLETTEPKWYWQPRINNWQATQERMATANMVAPEFTDWVEEFGIDEGDVGPAKVIDLSPLPEPEPEPEPLPAPSGAESGFFEWVEMFGGEAANAIVPGYAGEPHGYQGENGILLSWDPDTWMMEVSYKPGVGPGEVYGKVDNWGDSFQFSPNAGPSVSISKAEVGTNYEKLTDWLAEVIGIPTGLEVPEPPDPSPKPEIQITPKGKGIYRVYRMDDGREFTVTKFGGADKVVVIEKTLDNPIVHPHDFPTVKAATDYVQSLPPQGPSEVPFIPEVVPTAHNYDPPLPPGLEWKSDAMIPTSRYAQFNDREKTLGMATYFDETNKPKTGETEAIENVRSHSKGWRQVRDVDELTVLRDNLVAAKSDGPLDKKQATAVDRAIIVLNDDLAARGETIPMLDQPVAAPEDTGPTFPKGEVEYQKGLWVVDPKTGFQGQLTDWYSKKKNGVIVTDPNTGEKKYRYLHNLKPLPTPEEQAEAETEAEVEEPDVTEPAPVEVLSPLQLPDGWDNWDDKQKRTWINDQMSADITTWRGGKEFTFDVGRLPPDSGLILGNHWRELINGDPLTGQTIDAVVPAKRAGEWYGPYGKSQTSMFGTILATAHPGTMWHGDYHPGGIGVVAHPLVLGYNDGYFANSGYWAAAKQTVDAAAKKGKKPHSIGALYGPTGTFTHEYGHFRHFRYLDEAMNSATVRSGETWSDVVMPDGFGEIPDTSVWDETQNIRHLIPMLGITEYGSGKSSEAYAEAVAARETGDATPEMLAALARWEELMGMAREVFPPERFDAASEVKAYSALTDEQKDAFWAKAGHLFDNPDVREHYAESAAIYDDWVANAGVQSTFAFDDEGIDIDLPLPPVGPIYPEGTYIETMQNGDLLVQRIRNEANLEGKRGGKNQNVWFTIGDERFQFQRKPGGEWYWMRASKGGRNRPVVGEAVGPTGYFIGTTGGTEGDPGLVDWLEAALGEAEVLAEVPTGSPGPPVPLPGGGVQREVGNLGVGDRIILPGDVEGEVLDFKFYGSPGLVDVVTTMGTYPFKTTDQVIVMPDEPVGFANMTAPDGYPRYRIYQGRLGMWVLDRQGGPDEPWEPLETAMTEGGIHRKLRGFTEGEVYQSRSGLGLEDIDVEAVI